MAAISAFRVTQHSQIFSLFFRNLIQCITLYQLYNSQALLNLHRGYYNSLQSFKQIKQKTPEILHFYFFIVLQHWRLSYLNENEAENVQNGDVHLAQIPDFEMGYLENHLAH